jgi:hypothetical protein
MMLHSSLSCLRLRDPLPASIYAINALGVPRPYGVLNTESPGAFSVTRHRLGTAPPQRILGPSKGLPYYLQDSRQTGYSGRKVPGDYLQHGLPTAAGDCSDAHSLSFLTRFGSQNVGNLVIGDESLYRYLTFADEPPLIGAKDRCRFYPRFADVHLTQSGDQASGWASSAIFLPGEDPKFAVRVLDDHRVRSVLVKFSGRRETPAGLRSADLLIAEWLASEVLRNHGFEMAQTRPHEFDGRVFLEIDRFDRVGPVGRRGISSLLCAVADRYGKLDTWSLAAERLHRDNLLSANDLRRIKALEGFARLIGDNDRHLSHITFYDQFSGPFELAPTYGVLPAAFAPGKGIMSGDSFRPQPPPRDLLKNWPEALLCTEHYWGAISHYEGLSQSFRSLGDACLRAVRAMR